MPAGFLGMLALIVLVEATADRITRPALPPFEARWRFVSEASHSGESCDVVVLGDSLLMHGIDPASLQARLGPGRRVYNLGLPGATLATQYYVLARLLRAGTRPSAILVDGELSVFDPLSRGMLWARLAGLPELADLTWHARDLDFLARAAASRLLPTLAARGLIRGGILDALNARGGPPPAPRGIWLASAGAEILADRSDPGGDPRPALLERERYRPGPYVAHPLEATYARRLLALADASGIRVIWLLPPYHPEVTRRRSEGGWIGGYSRGLRRLQGQYPRLVVLSGLHSGYPPEALADMTHLSRRGAEEFSRAVGDHIRDLLDRRPTAAWVELPPFGHRPPEFVARSPSVGSAGTPTPNGHRPDRDRR